MSISLVQSQTLNNGANVLVSPNTAGSVLLVYAIYDGTSAGTISVSDSNGNSYTQLSYHTFATGGPQTSAVALFVAKNINSGANTITLSNSQTSTGHFAVAAEYSGVDTTNPVHADQFEPYPFPPGTSNLAVTIATAINNDVVALFYQNRNCTGITLPGGFSSQQQVIAGGDASGYSDATIVSAGSAGYTVDFTTTGATGGAIWGVSLTAPPTLVSIAVTPTSAIILPSGHTQQFTAIATYNDSSTLDVTGTATWASDTPGVATIASGGLATSGSSGTTNITATQDAITSPAVVLTVDQFSISGNAGAPFAVVSYTGPASGSATADFYADYTITGLPVGTFTLTPALVTFNFFPTSRTETITSSNLTDVDFQAAGISAPIGSVATVHSYDGTSGYLLVNADTLFFFNKVHVLSGVIAVGDTVYFRWPEPGEEEEAFDIRKV